MTESERAVAERLVDVLRRRHPELTWKVAVGNRDGSGSAPTGTAEVVRLEPGTDEPEAIGTPYPDDTDQAA